MGGEQMAQNYIVKSVETGKVVGDFQYIAYGRDMFGETNFGHAHCENCGKAIMWQYFFKRTDSNGSIVLGSECAKNVPKFTHAYKEFALFKKKVELLARLQGKKLKDIRNSPVVSCSVLGASVELKSVDSQIAEIKAKEQAVKDTERMKQKSVIDAIAPLIAHNLFLNSIHSQWSNGNILTAKQVEVALRVASESKPKIDAQKSQEQTWNDQKQRLRKFIKGHNNGYNGSFPTWYDFNVTMDNFTRDLIISFYNQLNAGKILTEKQLEVLAKKEHRYRKQLGQNQQPTQKCAECDDGEGDYVCDYCKFCFKKEQEQMRSMGC